MKRWPLWAGGGMLLAALLAALVVWLNVRDEPRDVDAPAAPLRATPEQIERGAYLARAGNCSACHTVRGGAPFAGGVGIETPFGIVFGSNLTPDAETGLGRWSAAQFWRALHNGRSRDGRLLFPAFPYPSFTNVTREDSDALFAWLRTLPPVRQPNRRHALRFPYDSQVSLAVWRALFFRPAAYRPEPARSAEWNRGSYLVRGFGHCEACHASRNWLGATTTGGLELGGGLIPMQKWYAPSLASPREAGVAGWAVGDIVAFLKTGVAPQAWVEGPMAEVVYRSTQYLSEDDLRAMAVFLQQLPQATVVPSNEIIQRDPVLMQHGATLYKRHCADCHGERGEGAPGAYPALAGNRGVTLASPANLVRIVVYGGYLPATAGNPRPYGMPPFSHQLDDRDIATLLTYIRGSWGNDAEVVSPLQVLRYR